MDWAFIGAARAGHRYTTGMHQSKCTSPHDDVVNALLSMGGCMYIPSSLSQKLLVYYRLLMLNLFREPECQDLQIQASFALVRTYARDMIAHLRHGCLYVIIAFRYSDHLCCLENIHNAF